jgi:hypothetical protein
VEPEEVHLEEEPVVEKSERDTGSKATKKKKKKKRKKKPVEEVIVAEPEPDEEEEEESPSDEEEVVDTGGLECSPAVSEVELRRPIPISCGVTKDRRGVSRIEVRYKPPGKKKFLKLVLNKSADEWTGEIPCAATAKPGDFKLSFSARNAGGRLIAKIDTVTIRLVEQTTEPPPSYPGKDPPMRCYDSSECPPEFRGTPACPGTKGSPASTRKGWGGTCETTADCQSGLACINGTCDQAPKCDTTADCPSGGECSDGVCQFPDPEELASRLKDPRFNWVGIHFGMDVMLVREAVGVCGVESEDRKDYACYRGGDPYEGPANQNVSGNVKAGFRMATMRVMASYERWFGRIAFGGRLGFAFGGAPEGFNPLHLEARALYSLRKDPMTRRGRPYLGLVAGLAQADPRSKLNIFDCSEGVGDCEEADIKTQDEFTALNARRLKVDAYRKGSKLFLGPAVGYVYAFTNDQGIQFNLNVMLPDLVFEPSVGYVFGL